MDCQDTAVCPECGLGFAVTRYGRRIACPGCGEALDIRPDEAPPDRALPEDFWRGAVRLKMEWLASESAELLEGGFRDAAAVIERDLARLRLFAGKWGVG